MRAEKAFNRVQEFLEPGMVILDVGSGDGRHAKDFRALGYEVFTCDSHHRADYQVPFEKMPIGRRFDVVWASHVLEHVDDPIRFLNKMMYVCKEDGLMVVTVPPWKPEIVGGHIHLYIPGNLVYQAVYSGWDCSKAEVYEYGYNISLINKNRQRPYVHLNHDSGDVNTLLPWFPYREGFKEGQKFIP